MGNQHESITDDLKAFAESQPMFFVATAPLSGDGHVNVSPKGLDSFAILGPKEVAYLDLGGSGIETHAHVVENGRITLMFCAFDGEPLILRVYGNAEVLYPRDAAWSAAIARFPDVVGSRQIFNLDIDLKLDFIEWWTRHYERDTGSCPADDHLVWYGSSRNSRPPQVQT